MYQELELVGIPPEEVPDDTDDDDDEPRRRGKRKPAAIQLDVIYTESPAETYFYQCVAKYDMDFWTWRRGQGPVFIGSLSELKEEEIRRGLREKVTRARQGRGWDTGMKGKAVALTPSEQRVGWYNIPPPTATPNNHPPFRAVHGWDLHNLVKKASQPHVAENTAAVKRRAVELQLKHTTRRERLVLTEAVWEDIKAFDSGALIGAVPRRARTGRLCIDFVRLV